MIGLSLLVVVVALASTACVPPRYGLRVHLVAKCADGLPVRVLIHPACPPDGICGSSCLPDRWDLFEP